MTWRPIRNRRAASTPRSGSALTIVGGGYALAADRWLTFLVHDVPSASLAPVMAQIIGQPERQEAIKAAIERRRNGEA